MACYRQSNENYTESYCEISCRHKFSDCQKEIDSSLLVKAYYDYSRIFHKLGMWSCDVWWVINDEVDSFIGKGVAGALHKSLVNFLDKVKRIKESFTNYRTTKEKRQRREADSNVEVLWIDFKASSISDDPKMVQLIENTKWFEFESIYGIMVDILSDSTVWNSLFNEITTLQINLLLILTLLWLLSL